MSSIIVISGDGFPGHKTMWTEDEGVTWTDCTGGIENVKVIKIVRADRMWMAAGDLGTIWTSLNGKAWTQQSFEHDLNGHFKDLAFGNGSWIVVGNLAYFVGEDVVRVTALQSVDAGVTWTELTLGVSWSSGALSVVFGAATWVIGGGTPSGTTTPMVTSTDGGATWTPVTITGALLDTVEALGYANGIIAAWASVDNVPYFGSELNSTDDGATWTHVPFGSLDPSNAWRTLRMASDGSTFLAAGQPFGGTFAAHPEYHSTDGEAWSSIATGWSNQFWHDVCWDGVRWIIGGYADHGGLTPTPVVLSTDRITWTGVPMPENMPGGPTGVGGYSIPPPPTQAVAGVAGRRVKRLGPIR